MKGLRLVILGVISMVLVGCSNSTGAGGAVVGVSEEIENVSEEIENVSEEIDLSDSDLTNKEKVELSMKDVVGERVVDLKLTGESNLELIFELEDVGDAKDNYNQAYDEIEGILKNVYESKVDYNSIRIDVVTETEEGVEEMLQTILSPEGVEAVVVDDENLTSASSFWVDNM